MKEEKRKPDFVVRAKVKDDVWVTIGAAWSAQLKGRPCRSPPPPQPPKHQNRMSAGVTTKQRSDACEQIGQEPLSCAPVFFSGMPSMSLYERPASHNIGCCASLAF